ncbi:AMP-dependent synthetase/ligase [Streptacidiphilus jiangxiensis]|uniref:Long-chain acyl-CoA synthetase n=1 Tax=Streptacidiphilus jiangxiensis TaxID=235985 RepID=A0A1H7X1T8_STRJI|nr:AMP-dependent synthetase/ligase [Streptacidiphilus jiangxiensis]SEM27822.1 long-chain acyl-CoA synthetase [Streptacidiphilus jiangxiensis]
MREFSVPALARCPKAEGLAESVYRTAQETPDKAVLARRNGDGWVDVDAAAFRDQVLAVAKGLLQSGIRFGDRVAVMARTRYEWTVLDYALWSLGAQPVPVYPTSSAEQLRWILADTRAVACVVEHEDHAMTVGSVCDGLTDLQHIWQLDAGALEQLALTGQAVPDEVVNQHRQAVVAETVATVIYTSGTTGRPKGCVLTHGNFLAEVENILARYGEVFDGRGGEEPATLLFLPLAHVFGRMIQVAAVRAGIRLGHEPSTAPADLLPALASFRPTFLLAVPYVFEKMLRRARQRAEESGRAAAFEKAYHAAVRYAEALERQAFDEGPGPSATLRMQHQLYESLVYGKVRAVLGGRLRYAMSGGSAMSREQALFFRGAGVTVLEGYGLTETTAAATANPPERVRFGTVGTPIPGTSVLIAEDGEVWVSGGQVFRGYLHDADSTGRTLRGGWLATGDLGHLDRNGYLHITGRKKEIIVTSGGKSVAPVALEDRIRTHPLVGHCALVGDDRPFVAALITLDAEALDHWLRVRGRPSLTPQEAAADPDIHAELQRAVLAANTAVSRAESVRAFRVLPIDFTEESGLLTPSLKLRRRAITRACAADIDALYSDAASAAH